MFGVTRAAQLAATLPEIQPQIEAWTTGSLERVVYADVFGDLEGLPLTRAAAMMVPAVARARHLTASTIARLPLEAFRTDERVEPAPYWMQGTDGQAGRYTPAELTRRGLIAQSPWGRMLWTVDDLLFYGLSAWLVTDRYTTDGRPSRMLRIPWSAWTVDESHRVVDVDGRPWPEGDVIVIPGPHEGILTFGAPTIGTAAELERTAADVARRPFRLELHQTTDVQLSKTERAELVNETRAALERSDGVLFTNSAIETKTHSMNSDALLIAGRNASALDVARDVSMPAAMLDATTEGASLEYQTTVARNQQWLDYGLSMYMDAITARLGMDDVLPAGQRAALDTTELTEPVASPTGAPTED